MRMEARLLKQLLPAGGTWGGYADVGSSDIFPDIGILGTPVVDPTTNVVYLVAKSKTISGGAYQQRLYALNLADGSEHTAHVSIDNSITVPGTCDGGCLENSTPNNLSGTLYCRGGIWMSGGAPVIDSGNNVYVMTGNGIFDASSGGSNYGDSYMKLSRIGLFYAAQSIRPN
jgi:hypothetical protein